MANRLSGIIRTMFPNDFGELTPVKEHWWHRIDLSFLKRNGRGWISGLFVTVFSVTLVYYYNIMLNLESNVEAADAQIAVQLQRRKDLIINLSKTVMDYEKYEAKLFTYMADKRSDSVAKSDIFKEAKEVTGAKGAKEVMNCAGLPDLSKLPADKLAETLGSLMALAENYPQLTLSANFQKLMDALINIEDRIVEQRMLRNDACNKYGTYIEYYPQKIFSVLLRFKQCEFVRVDDDVAQFNRLAFDERVITSSVKGSVKK